MLKVVLAGNSVSLNGQESRSIAEVVDWLKNEIDSERVISAVMLDGELPGEDDWQRVVAEVDGVLELYTDGRQEYLSKRLPAADSYLSLIYDSMNSAISSFKKKSVDDGNLAVSQGVDELLAFTQWYFSLLSLDTVKFEKELLEFQEIIGRVHKLCEKLVEPHMQESWWAVANILEKEFLPELSNLQNLSTRAAATFS